LAQLATEVVRLTEHVNVSVRHHKMEHRFLR
jgi:hypothetical protein